MKRIELYEAPKRQEITKYIEQLGIICTPHSGGPLKDYTSAYTKVLLLANRETSKKMEEVHNYIVSRYDSKLPFEERMDCSEILNTEVFKDLIESLKKEITA